jgi:hypothetical protein
MVRKVASGLAGLGLLGGAGSVVYNQHGDAIVKVTDKSGHVHKVRIDAGGKSFSCPSGTHDKVAAMDIRLGRIKLTLLGVRRTETTIERRYPANATPPRAVAVRYNTLRQRDHRLVVAYNAQVEAHNAAIRQDCTTAN